MQIACVTAANKQDRAQIAKLAEEVQAATGAMVEVAFLDQSYTREQRAGAAEAKGLRLEVLKLPTTRCGFVLPPVALWSSGASPGQHAPAARTVSMSACLKPRLACISCPS